MEDKNFDRSLQVYLWSAVIQHTKLGGENLEATEGNEDKMVS